MKLQRLLSRPRRLVERAKRRAEEAAAAFKLAAMMKPKHTDTNRHFGEWLHTAAGRVWRRKRGAA